MQYDEVADQYEERIAPKYAPIAELVAERASLQPRDRVVELAAGTGLLTRRLAPRVLPAGRYVATDVAAPMLAVARRRLPPTVELLVADLRAVPVADAAADVVVASLSPVQDSVRGLREAFRLLRPGGRLTLGFWGGGYTELRVLAAVRRDLGLGAFPASPVSRARRRAAAAGFADVDVERFRLSVTHDSLDAYVAYRAAFGRPAWFPAGLEEEVPRALRRHAAGYLADDGTVRLDWTVCVMTATRPRRQVIRPGGPR